MSTHYGESDEQYPKPRCPRHPDQVTYISCQRCGRPTCTKCQVSAPVGVRCVDCAKEYRRTKPVARTVAGARIAPTLGTTTATKTILWICIGAHLLSLLLPAVQRELMFVPALGAIQPWRFITSAFLHASFLHIALNMLALWMLGQGLEPVLGKARFVALYLLSAFGGSVAVLLLASPYRVDWFTGAVGASGAIFGMFGALFVLQKKADADLRAISILIAVNLAYGFIVSGVSWQAHVGGLVTGALVAYFFVLVAQRRWRWGAWALSAVVFALLVGASVLKYALVS